jgi:hypothetical protein
VLRGDALVFNLPLESAAQLKVLYSNIPLKLVSGNFLLRVLFQAVNFYSTAATKIPKASSFTPVICRSALSDGGAAIST